MIQFSRGQAAKDIETAAETPIPLINIHLKSRNISKSPSTAVISQMMDSEHFDSYIDKKNKELH